MDVEQDILDYVEKHIIPQYEYFDKAHGTGHVIKVIANSFTIAKDYDVDSNLVYVIAAYHDIGLAHGREDHEKNSTAYLLSDKKLMEWFSDADIIIMAEAVRDHRASNDYEPRSIYGKIVSEADRDIDYTVILTRTIQYGLDKYPEYSFDQHYDRAYAHIKEKYGEDGYLKLWLDTEVNRKNLREIRTAIKAEEKFKDDFCRIYYDLVNSTDVN